MNNLNLQKVLQKDSSIQKVVIVSNTENLDKFKDQIGKYTDDTQMSIAVVESLISKEEIVSKNCPD